MLKNITILASGRTSVSALNFARNIVLARLVSVEDYGIASTFIVSIAFIELLADLGLERMVVQDREGENRRFIGTLQTLMVLRGFLLAGLMFFIAEPIAMVFNHPELTWAYQLMGIVPLAHGFNNLDISRMQRSMSFGPQIKAELTGALLSLILLWPLAVWLGDFRIMLIALLAEYTIRCLATQVIAQNLFHLNWDMTVVKRALKFGLPLLASGVLAFASMQGDRVIVGNQFTARDLGLFSAAATLAMTPCLITAKIAQPFILAMLARVQDDRAKFDAQAALALQVMLCIGGAAAFAFSLLGPFIFELAFGEKMREGTAYVVPIGIAFSALLIQSGSLVPLSLARGRTMNPFLSNLVRLAALPVGFAIVLTGGSVLDLTMVMIAGETASGITGAILAATRVKTSAPLRTLPAYLAGLVLLGVLTYSAFAGLGGPWVVALQAGLLLATVLACGDLRRFALAEARARLGKKAA